MNGKHDQRESLVLNLTVGLIDAVEAIARKEGRSPAQWVESVLESAVESTRVAGYQSKLTGRFAPPEAPDASGLRRAPEAPVDQATMRDQLHTAWAGLSEIELDAAIWGWVDSLATGRDATNLLPEETVHEVLKRFGLDIDTSLEDRDVPRSALRKRARQAVRGGEGSGLLDMKRLGELAHDEPAEQNDVSGVHDRRNAEAPQARPAPAARPVLAQHGPQPVFSAVDTSAFSMADVQSLEALYEAACRSWRGSGPAEEARRAGNDAIMALLRGDYATARESAERARDFEKAYHRGFAWSTFWQRVHNETMGRMMEARPVRNKVG